MLIGLEKPGPDTQSSTSQMRGFLIISHQNYEMIETVLKPIDFVFNIQTLFFHYFYNSFAPDLKIANFTVLKQSWLCNALFEFERNRHMGAKELRTLGNCWIYCARDWNFARDISRCLYHVISLSESAKTAYENWSSTRTSYEVRLYHAFLSISFSGK